MTNRRLRIGWLLALGLILPALAFAGTTRITDPKDARGIDIKSVKASPLSGRRWKFVITFYARIPPQGNSGNEDLELWKARPRPLKGAPAGAFQEGPYTIQGPQTGKQPITTGGHDQPVVRHGTATISRRGSQLTIVFPLKAIGNPHGAFWWYMTSQFYGSQKVCGTSLPDHCSDHAPNGRTAVKQTL